MAKRIRTMRFDAASVQGEDAYVELSALTYGEHRQAQKERELLQASDNTNKPEELAKQTQNLIITHLVAWNWVQDDGTPMPVPTLPDDFNKLTMPELMFLSTSLGKVIAGANEGTNPN